MELEMQRETDLAYFARRATEEREKAENAKDPAGYRMHMDFAREYERKVQSLQSRVIDA
ncbi:hypothetical protein [Sphingomonas sp. KR3-1]|uniref:hypothetical protein n=1 Tax=Sphingomonas sp. KR3-1 TaxID=3156611 RepID=UPI0032B5E568